MVGLYLCSLAEIEQLLAEDALRIAPGLVQSLPVYLAHLASTAPAPNEFGA